MIEINLSQKRDGRTKKMFLPGSPLRHLNFKAIALAFGVCFFGELSLSTHWKEEQGEHNSNIDGLRETLNLMQEESQKLKGLRRELTIYKNKIKELELQSADVDQVLSTRSNPKELLERVAKSMPGDLWLTKLEILSEGDITFEGMSISYKSIGDFMSGLNGTPFFGNSLNLSESNTLEEEDTGNTRIEKFNIKGRVKDFNPFKN